MPKGYLFLIGRKTDSSFIFDRLFEIAGGKENAHIAIIPSIDSLDGNIIKNYEQYFVNEHQVQKENIWTLPIAAFENKDAITGNGRTDAAGHKELAHKIANYNIVFFEGGDQRAFVDSLKKNNTESPLFSAIEKIYKDGGIIAAAGDAVNILVKRSIAGGTSEEALLNRVVLKDDDLDSSKILMLDGVHLIDNVIFDTYSEIRGRLVRLSDAVVLTNNIYGIGISENTAVIINPELTIEVIGEGSVFLCDLKDARIVNLSREQLHARNINVTLLTHEDKYKYLTKEFFPAPGKVSIINTPYFDANDYHVSLNVFKEYDTSQILINYMLDNEAKDVIALMDYNRVFSHEDISTFMRFTETDETKAWFKKLQLEKDTEAVNSYSGTNVQLDIIPVKYIRETTKRKSFNVVIFGINNDVQAVVFDNLKSLPICDAKITIFDSHNNLIFKKGTDRYGRAVFHKLFKEGETYLIKVTYDDEEKKTGFTLEPDMTGICIY